MRTYNDMTKRYFKDLIDIYFHRDSYFSLCLSKAMNHSISFDESHDEHLLTLIHIFINQLIEAEHASAELDNLSALLGFQGLIDRMEKFANQIELIGSDVEKTKHSITAFARFFLNEVKTRVQNENAQKSLMGYLGLGKAYYIPEKMTVPGSNERLLDKFFQEEIAKALKSVEKYDSLKSWELNKEDYYRDWEKCSQEIKSLALMHGNHEIEALADRIHKLVGIYSSANMKPNFKTKKILTNGKNAIFECMLNKNYMASLRSMLISFDQYLLDIEGRVLNEESDEEKISTESEGLLLQEDCASPELELKIPGEDDPELLSLIDEISKVRNNGEKEFNIIPGPGNGNHAFAKENMHLIKLIRRAVSDLSENKCDLSALEDLELASSSLKGSALKHGYEELSELPDTIENIAIVLMDKKLPISTSILNIIIETMELIENFANTSSSLEKSKIILDELNLYIDLLFKQKDQERFFQIGLR